MSPPLKELLSGDERRRCTANARRVLLGQTLVVALPILFLAGVERVYRHGFDLKAHLADPPVCFLCALVATTLVALIQGGLGPHLVALEVQRRFREAQAALAGHLAPEEKLELLCLVRFLDRSFTLGFLVVTDRRLLRLQPLERPFLRRAWSAGHLCAREELERVDLTLRHSGGKGAWGAALQAAGLERGLWIRSKDERRWFVNMDEEVVRAIWTWFRDHGVAVSERDDSDLAAPEVPSPVDLRPL